MIDLREVDETNWRLPLQVAPDQKKFVSEPFRLLARAYAYRNSRSRALVIYDSASEQAAPVGMAMYYDCEPMQAYCLSQLFIDEKYQRRGYGRQSMQALMQQMREDGKYQKVILCYVEGDIAAETLYTKLGFTLNGVRDGDEIGMEYYLTPKTQE